MREIGTEHFYIELVEEYSCDNIEQLNRREGHFIREFNSYNNGYNGVIAGRNKKEYYGDNKEQRTEYNKEYYEAHSDDIRNKGKEYYKNNRDWIVGKVKEYREKNKDKISEYKKEYIKKNREKLYEKIECECGAEVCWKNFSRHCKSIKHQNFLNSKK
jgi:hypothetical protein